MLVGAPVEHDDPKQAEQQILDEVSGLLFEHLAAAEWGRLLVVMELTQDGEAYQVVDLQIEDVIGDEAKIEAAMRGEGSVAMIPVLAEATLALCELTGVDLEEVGGGTFVRRADGGVAFLPGLVRVPSDGFEALVHERVDAAMARQRELETMLGVRDRFELDLRAGTITFLDGDRVTARARATLLGSFSDTTRTWAWAWGNDTLPEELRAPSRDLCDRFARRDLWELTTAQFSTDLGTCWQLAALLTAEAGASGFYRAPQDHRHVFLLLEAVTPGSSDDAR